MDLFDLSAKITLDSSGYERGLKDAESKTSSFGSKIGGALKTLGKVTLAGLGAAAAGVAALTKSAVSSYADYEQLVGGVETLFSSLDGSVSAAGDVLANAANAYRTAGLSANQYMETVTSFSAALVSSLEGDYSKAAKISDMAITDMADNANKMGTDMESIQMAYQGFAKQNYTMLDNLKLGYGGTKTEMERLLKDAQELSGVEYNIDNLSDVYEAIHVIQGELGITGTTAKEAASTISGSAAMMKSAWSNLMVGIADDSADFDTLINNFVSSAGTFADNILPRISTAIGGVGQLIEALAPQIATALPAMLTTAVPALLTAASSLIEGFVGAITTSLPTIVEQGLPIIMSLVEGILQNLPALVEAGLQILIMLANGISESLPELIPVVVDVMLQIVETLIDNIDLLVEAAVEIIVALAEGLIEATPRLMEKAPEIIMKLLVAIINALPILLEAGLEIIVMIGQGIVNAVGQLLSKGREIVTKVIDGIKGKFGELRTKGRELVNKVGDGIKGAVSSAASWGRDLVQNFVNGITSRLSSLASTVSNMASTIRSHLHFSEPDVGPLSDFHTYAPDMMELFAKGIRDNKKMLLDTVDDAFNFQDMIVSPTLEATALSANGFDAYGQSGVAIYGDVNITVDGTGKNAEEIGRDLYKILSRQGVTAYAV